MNVTLVEPEVPKEVHLIMTEEEKNDLLAITWYTQTVPDAIQGQGGNKERAYQLLCKINLAFRRAGMREETKE